MPGVKPRNVPTARKPEVVTERNAARIKQMTADAAVPLIGVTTSEGPLPGLFPIKPTGISTATVVDAAKAYIHALNVTERQTGVLPMDSETWRHWANGALYLLRHGNCLEDLSEPRRELAVEIMRQSLSNKGFYEARDTMRLNQWLGVLTGLEIDLDEWLYWFTIYGDPSTDGAWGWQLDGHHMNINCAFIGDQMVMTPQFVGAEPVYVDGGPHAGIRMFRIEEEDTLKFVRGFDANQLEAAVITNEMPSDLFLGAARDNFEMNYQGIPFGGLDAKQQHLLLNLAGLYVRRMRHGHSKVWMDNIMEHTDQMHFAWVGGTADDSVFYYRIHSPVIIIEFEHQAGQLFDNEEIAKSHVHTVVRTPNGNDYGRDLLRQHHETHPH